MFEFTLKKEKGNVINKKYDMASDFLQEVESGDSDLSEDDIVRNVIYSGECLAVCEGITVIELYMFLCSDACDWFG